MPNYSAQNTPPPPVVVFGNSFATNTCFLDMRFAKLLAEYLKCPVYDKAFDNFGLQNIYYMASGQNLYKEIKNPKAVIIFYNSDIPYIMYDITIWNPLRYKCKNGKLIREPFWVLKLHDLYLIQRICGIIAYNKRKNFDKCFDDMKIYFIESKRLMQQNWPNAKFIIVKYVDEKDIDNPVRWGELEKEGFSIVEVSDILGEGFRDNPKFLVPSDSDRHPSFEALDNIASYLSKKHIITIKERKNGKK